VDEQEGGREEGREGGWVGECVSRRERGRLENTMPTKSPLWSDCAASFLCQMLLHFRRTSRNQNPLMGQNDNFIGAVLLFRKGISCTVYRQDVTHTNPQTYNSYVLLSTECLQVHANY